ncbi:disks large homolog 5-like, partial [Psammomys obesus]|uniref:disks large homolog 5-like n=1 Tax=Psammomys obesus TaxID=48139 RepID=UPI002452FBD9
PLSCRERNELCDHLILVTEGSLDNSNLHSRLLMEQTRLKRKVDMLRQENKKVQEDWALLQHQLVDMQQICEDQEEETCNLQTQELYKERETGETLQNARKQKQPSRTEREGCSIHLRSSR